MPHITEIVELGYMDWAKDIVGNPMESFEEMAYSWELRKVNDKRHLPKQPTGHSTNDYFAKRFSEFIRAVAKVNGVEEAKKVQAAALKLMKRKEIREALDVIPAN